MSEVCGDLLEVSWKHSFRAWSEHSSGHCPGNSGPDYAPPLLHSQCCEELKYSQNTAAVITSLCTVQIVGWTLSRLLSPVLSLAKCSSVIVCCVTCLSSVFI